MNYFQPYSLPADQMVLAAWDSQLYELADCPALISVSALANQRELFPRYAACYTRLRSLPRGTRRALQRKLARARELISIQPEWQRKLAGSLAGTALLLALAQSAGAATTTVTTNVPDINDSDGKCSLIEAIINANNDAATHPDCAAGSGPDTIVLPKDSTQTLTSAYINYHGDSGLPVITSSITIKGKNAQLIRKNNSAEFRIFTVNISGEFSVNNLNLSNGSEVKGGGIINYGVVNLQQATIVANRANSGGGI
jgi:hypothetical protein